MRFALSVLPVLAVLACSAEPAAESATGAQAARLVDPGDFENPDCMLQHLDEVNAVVDEFSGLMRESRERYLEWYRDAQAAGAPRHELEAFKDEALRERSMFEDMLHGTLADLEQALCGGAVDCDDASDPDCYCDQNPQDPNCWTDCDQNGDGVCDECDFVPDDPNCWTDCDRNGDGVCDACDEAPDRCDPFPDDCYAITADGDCLSYCDVVPDDPDCWNQPPCDDRNDPDCWVEPPLCDDPNDPACWGEPCDPATGMDCPTCIDVDGDGVCDCDNDPNTDDC